jgi:hypothetical protein
MTRPAERVLNKAAANGPTTAKAGRWRRLRRVLGLQLLIAALFAAVVAGIVQIGFDTLIQLAGAVALLVIAAGAAAVGALALVLRRRLAELKHLPDLGRPFVTNHEAGLVTGLVRDVGGNVVLEVTSEARQTIVMDEDGAPEHISAGGSGVVQLPIPGSSVAEPEVLHRLEALLTQKVPVRLVSEGVVALSGPVLRKWRLEAKDGLVLTNRL